MCQSNTQLILAVASGTEGLELYAAATLSTKRAIYIRKGLAGGGFDELEKNYEFAPIMLQCAFEVLVFLNQNHVFSAMFLYDQIIKYGC